MRTGSLRIPLAGVGLMAAACRTHIAVLCDDRLLRESLVQFLSEQSDFTLTTCEETAWPAEPCVPPPDIYLVDARTHHASYGVTIPHGAVVIFVGASEDVEWAAAARNLRSWGILPRYAPRERVIKALIAVPEG